MCTCSPESWPHPGLHQKKSGQQAKGGDVCPSLVLSPCAGSCCSPLGLHMDPRPDLAPQLAQGCWLNHLESPVCVPWGTAELLGKSIASAGVVFRSCWFPTMEGPHPPSCSLPFPVSTDIPFLVCMKFTNGKWTLFHFSLGRGLLRQK